MRESAIAASGQVRVAPGPAGSSSIGPRPKSESWLADFRKAVRHILTRIPPTVHNRGDELVANSGDEPVVSNSDRVSELWAEHSEKNRAAPGVWVNNSIICSNVNHLMTGGPQHWLTWLLEDYFHDVPSFRRVLSICCGDGAHELQMLQTGKVEFLQGFDISQGAIDRAIERFKEAGIPENKYLLDVRDANNLDITGTFDLAIAAGSVHHVTNLEDLLEKTARMLGPDGRFAISEFVGPDRFQWTDDQIDLVNRLLGALDPRFLKDGTPQTFVRPTVEAMINWDPSESIRSSAIPGVIRRYFDVKYERSWHGTILHLLYQLVNTNLANKDRADFDSIIRLLVQFEDILINRGVLPTNFVFMVCHPKTGARAVA